MVTAIRRLLCLALVTSASLAAMGTAAQAANYTVATTADPRGTCVTPPCSLRQLIAKVHATPFPPDTISVPAGTYRLDAALGALTITDNLSIVGAGARATTIAVPVPADRSASGNRVFEISVPTGGTSPTVAISGVTVTGGTAHSGNGFFGGDILNDSAALTLTDDWITNGSAYSGGGVGNTQGTTTIERTLLSNNHAPYGGGDSGAILNHGIPAGTGTPDRPGHLVVDSSTITGNDARLVGGIFSFNDATNTLVVSNSTIVGNAGMDEPGGPFRAGGGGVGTGSGSALIQNTILAGNVNISAGVTTPANCGLTAAGPIISTGSNIDTGSDCFFTSAGDLSNTDPLLGPLQDNGGPTDTFALLAGSPALDKVAPGANCSASDQRGVARPQGAACDIGAFEFSITPPPSTPPPTGGKPPTGSSNTPLRGLGATSSGTFLFFRQARTQVDRLVVGPLPAGTTVALSCTSPRGARRSARCPFKAKRFEVRKATRNLQLAKYFKRRKLALRTTIRIRATKPGRIGLHAQYTTRNKKVPTKRLRCLLPGSSKPVNC